MYKALSPGVIGVSCPDLESLVSAARAHGFQGVEIGIGEVANRLETAGAAFVRDLLGEIRPAGFGLPTEWRGDEEKYQLSLAELPRLAASAAEIGCTRTFTWILPGSNDRDLAANHEFHVCRFTPIAKILGDHGIHLGLEFIGPKTSRDSFAYPFHYTSADMLAMGREIGQNVGLLVDAWHWYTGEGTIADLQKLKASDVVYVHVNDAPANVDIHQQLDHVRALPAETGVIPIGHFLTALDQIGYDGPVVAEPFKKELADLSSDADRLSAISHGLDAIFRQAAIQPK